MARVFICYEDNIYGHMLGAICAKYIKETYPKEDIVYWPNLKKDTVSEDNRDMTIPLHIGVRDSIYILGETPAPRSFRKLIHTLSPKYIFWSDFETQKAEKVYDSDDFKGYDIKSIPGIRTEVPCLGVRLWKNFFPGTKVPPCVTWIDDYYQGNPDMNARAFVHGLKLLETCPSKLEEEPDTRSEEERDEGEVASTVWEACFEVAKPADFSSPDFNPEVEMTRMTWDATYQIMNMGNIVDTLVRLETQSLIDRDKFRVLTLPDNTPVLLANTREADPEVIREMFTKTQSTVPYAGWYYLDCKGAPHFYVTIVKLPEGSSCIELARKFDHPVGHDNYASFRCDSLEYKDQRYTFAPHMYESCEKTMVDPIDRQDRQD